MSRSSTKVEYQALSSMTCEIQWLHLLLKDLGVLINDLTSIFCDNKFVIFLAPNPTFHEKSKYIEKIQGKLIHLLLVSNNAQMVDAFTKPLHLHPSLSNLYKLGLWDIYSPT